jgi:hypothetical protein
MRRVRYIASVLAAWYIAAALHLEHVAMNLGDLAVWEAGTLTQACSKSVQGDLCLHPQTTDRRCSD